MWTASPVTRMQPTFMPTFGVLKIEVRYCTSTAVCSTDSRYAALSSLHTTTVVHALGASCWGSQGAHGLDGTVDLSCVAASTKIDCGMWRVCVLAMCKDSTMCVF